MKGHANYEKWGILKTVRASEKDFFLKRRTNPTKKEISKNDSRGNFFLGGLGLISWKGDFFRESQIEVKINVIGKFKKFITKLLEQLDVWLD